MYTNLPLFLHDSDSALNITNKEIEGTFMSHNVMGIQATK